MGLLKHFRSKSKFSSYPVAATYTSPTPPATYRARDCSSILPEPVLDIIFSHTCPHVLDYTYTPCEESHIADGCPLCDLRDLATCAQVCRKWYAAAQRLLYTSVRIDAVHYCELEEILGERRKRVGKKKAKELGLATHAGHVPEVRLALLCRTVREVQRLAEQVLLLKLPYVTRETAHSDLARTVSVLPNLRYVDLPDAFFTAHPTCLTLRQELQARCPDLRKMSYRVGSEGAFEWLARGHWRSLQTLELSGLALEPATFRMVLGSLPTLHELTISNMSWIDDTFFQPAPGRLPDFPPLQLLKLDNIPGVTAHGICEYLNAPHNRDVLSTLSLSGTGVTVQDLHRVLWSASNIQHLAIIDTVSKSLSPAASSQLPPLTSISLKTVHFEITSSDKAHRLQNPAETYYAYLATSLQQNALPALTTLYVRDPQFPELLTTSPSLPLGPTTAPFQQTLEIFSKGIDELEWVFTPFHPTTTTTTSSPFTAGRPLSAYSASRGLGPQWTHGGEARKSVIVGNGFGGFLAVPREEVPGRGEGRWTGEGQGEGKRGSRHDLWR